MAFSSNIVVVDLRALENNYREVGKLVPDPAKIIAVVKADAYGHGLLEVSRRLVRTGCRFLAVFRLEEAARLRDAGVTVPILVLMGLDEEESRAALAYDVIPVVYRLEDARRLNEVAKAGRRKLRVHLKVDTGMTRLGLPCGEVREGLERLRDLEFLELDGIVTHLASAEDPAERAFTLEQVRMFRDMVALARSMGFRPERSHVANSAACLGKLDTGSPWVRVGLLLYGANPCGGSDRRVRLEPVMSFYSKVVHRHEIPRGTGISYGRTYVAEKPSIITVVPVGYEDGYLRAFSNNGEMLVRGRRAPVRGRVCMNLTMLDVTGIPDVRVGDEVVILGRQGDSWITADELAGRLRTISYEIFTTFGKLNRRIHVDGKGEGRE